MAKRVRRVKRTRGKSRLKSAREIAEAREVNEIGDIGDAERDPDAHREGRIGGIEGAAAGGLDLGMPEAEIDIDPAGLEGVDAAIEVDAASELTGDNFGGDDGRSRYENIMRGHLAEDAARFAALRDKGEADAFDPELPASDLEQKGQIAAANHMVRLYDHWMLEGADRSQTIEKAAKFLGDFNRTDLIRKTITELESKPIRDVYPLEVMLEMLESAPHKLPGVSYGPLIGNADALEAGERVYVGHEVQIPIPPDTRLKGFALIGGERPGYEFWPGDKAGTYSLIVDTPGEWEFAVYGVKTKQLGKLTKELPGGLVHKFKVNVGHMGKKPPPEEAAV